MEKGDEDMNTYQLDRQTDNRLKKWAEERIGGRWERKGSSEGVNIFFFQLRPDFLCVPKKPPDTNNNTS